MSGYTCTVGAQKDITKKLHVAIYMFYYVSRVHSCYYLT